MLTIRILYIFAAIKFNGSVAFYRTSGTSLYFELGIGRNATPDEIKKAFRQVANFICFIFSCIKMLNFY